MIGLFKTEVIRPRGPWRSLEAVEFATLEWVDWFNNRRLLEPIGHIPPAEAEASYYDRIEMQPRAAEPKPNSLRKTRGYSDKSRAPDHVSTRIRSLTICRSKSATTICARVTGRPVGKVK